MKKLFSLLLVLLLVVGCSNSNNNNNNNNTNTEGGGELYIFMPGEYISDDLINNFEDETGIKLYITTFDSNESMYTNCLVVQYMILSFQVII